MQSVLITTNFVSSNPSQARHISSVSGPYSAIDPYVKSFFTPQLCSQP